MDTQIYLTHADHGRAMTWEEFRASDAELGYRYELIEGKVYVTSFPTLSHQCYRDWLYHTLHTYANEHPDLLARAMTFPAVFVPNPNTITFTRTDVACYAECWERFAPDA